MTTDTRDTAIGYERKGYGRGLILGLTMAETMLLLVFCLLLAAGAVIASTSEKFLEAEKTAEERLERIAELEVQLEELRNELAELIRRTAGTKLPDEEWRELVLARETAQAIEEKGLALQEALDLAEMTVAAQGAGITTAEEMQRLIQRVEEIAEENAAPHEWPPIITMSDLEGNSFAIGSAELTPLFRKKLTEKASGIRRIADEYGVEIIEVIGHTDEQAMPREYSNLDRNITPVLHGNADITTLTPADNAGLGLARALSVAQLLSSLPELAGLEILPMSGGQLVMPGDFLTDGTRAGDDPARRRIEIRVRKRTSGEAL